MKYSEHDFPIEDDLFLETVKEMWGNGWLDEFHENHFLIRAIYGEIPHFEKSSLQDAISPELYFDCATSLIFLSNFSQIMRRFIILCGTDQARRFVQEQLSAGKEKYSEDQFFEALHEVHVLRYLTTYGNPTVEYEPALGGSSGKKNPEYRIKNSFAIPDREPGKSLVSKEDYVIDVEVKSIVGNLDSSITLDKPVICPIFAIEYKRRDQLLEFCHNRGFQVELPNVIHLRDFVNNAAAKFEKPNKNNHFNILYLNWTYREIPIFNFMEPLSLLDNAKNGLLRYREIGLKFGLSEDVFEKISAIFIYSYPRQSIIFQDISWVFANRKCAVLFSPYLNQKQALQLTHILHMAPISNPQTPLILSYPAVTTLFDEIAMANLEGIDEVINDVMFL